MGVSKKLLTPSVIDAVVKKVNQKRITNSKDLRKLRAILPDPVAREQFLSDEGDLDSAMLRVAAPEKKSKSGLPGDLETAVEAMKNVPWTALQELKGDADILKRIDEAEVLLSHCVKLCRETTPNERTKKEMIMEQTNNQTDKPEADHHKTTIDISVNGEAEMWKEKKINYEQAVKLAFPHGPTGGDIRYSVSWTKPDGQEGSLRPGQCRRWSSRG